MKKKQDPYTSPIEVIYGNIPSKSNSYRIIKRGRHASLGLTKEASAYRDSFYSQCEVYRDAMMEGELGIVLHCYYDSRRPDLDGSSKVILDCLQKCGAFKNDNKVVYLEMHKHLDKENPRVEIRIFNPL